MAEEPRFFIIAGPNGAGKSTLGSALVPKDVQIFNGDLVFEQLCKQYPNIDPERLKGGVPMALEKARDTAILEESDFAFETNFSSNLTMDLAKQFKEKGYTINLIYVGLENTILAESRVKTRVKLGGHDIPSETINFNFNEGIKRVQNNLAFFDTSMFFNTVPTLEMVAFCDQRTQDFKLFGKSITWFNRHFKATLESLNPNKEIKQPQNPIVRQSEIKRKKRGKGLR
jgi:predicted ABC-type ATPase